MDKAELMQLVKNAGGYANVGTKMGTTKQVVWSWVNVLERIPAKWVTPFAELVKRPRHEIRPDIYPRDRELYR